MRLCLCLVAGLLAATPALARPLHYLLDPADSVVGFETDYGTTILRGTMSVIAADLTLDFDKVAASRVDVTLDAGSAAMNNPFASQAIKDDAVLAVVRFPEIRFESTSVTATDTGAAIRGRITIRGVTRDMTLDARLYRPKGTAEGERDNLSIHLVGSVKRSDFGATGYPNLVGDEVRLKIVAHIRQKG